MDKTFALFVLSFLLINLIVLIRAGTVEYGKVCKEDKDCTTDKAVCKAKDTKVDEEKICTCSDKLEVHDETKDRCLPKVTFGLHCEITAQCTASYPGEDVECRKDKNDKDVCLCKADHHFVEGKCYKSVDNGKACTDDNECAWVTHAECVKDKCACEDGYTYKEKAKECEENGAATLATSLLSVALSVIVAKITL